LNALRRLRKSEWVFITYFVYVALISFAFPLKPAVAPRPLLFAAAVFLLSFLLVQLERDTGMLVFSVVRDWLALFWVLVAYREMDWFTPPFKDFHLERAWVLWDRALFYQLGLKHWIESLGPLLPNYLEFCYVLVYAIGPFSVAALYVSNHRERADRFLVAYAVGTLASYALFPFFPSDPPRVVFPGSDLPLYSGAIRHFNLALVGGYGIHSSVFPSAHVSSAFAAAWGLMFVLPERPWFGRGMLFYAVSVAIATVYGRYHFAADALAGFCTSLLALGVVLHARRPATVHRRGHSSAV
jgi:membrane-associated phospholipid phosphatase